jgi:hypothetical protein
MARIGTDYADKNKYATKNLCYLCPQFAAISEIRG